MMKRGSNKKALSPVVASVLLVALVLVLAAIIFLWARGFIGEQIEKGEKPISDLCGEASFNMELIPKPSVDGIYTIEVINTGNVAIHKFTIVKRLEGSEERYEFDIGVGSQGKSRREADLRINGRKPESVTIYPALLGTVAGQSENRPYTCTENGKTETL